VCCKGDANCTLTCSGADVIECPGADADTIIYACGTECPTEDKCHYQVGDPVPDGGTPETDAGVRDASATDASARDGSIELDAGIDANL
jgi:hypothetical protein